MPRNEQISPESERRSRPHDPHSRSNSKFFPFSLSQPRLSLDTAENSIYSTKNSQSTQNSQLAVLYTCANQSESQLWCGFDPMVGPK